MKSSRSTENDKFGLQGVTDSIFWLCTWKAMFTGSRQEHKFSAVTIFIISSTFRWFSLGSCDCSISSFRLVSISKNNKEHYIILWKYIPFTSWCPYSKSYKSRFFFSDLLKSKRMKRCSLTFRTGWENEYKSLDILNSASRILQCWSYCVKINSATLQHDTERTKNRAGL